MSQLQTFLSDLFDISFSKFIAPRIVGLLYLVGILFAGLFSLTFIFGSIGAIFTGGQSTFLGILGLLLSPLMFLLYVTFVRVGLEGMVVGFRTAENTARTAENTEYLRKR